MRNKYMTIEQLALARAVRIPSGGSRPYCCVFSCYWQGTQGLRTALFAVATTIALASLFPATLRAEALDCPQISRKVPALLSADSEINRMTRGNKVDLADEIAHLVRVVKDENPNLSNDDITDDLLAAYCPAVARIPDISIAAKWRLIRQFDQVLLAQLAGTVMPPGSAIIANVALSQAVYQKLSGDAKTAKETPTEFMADILTRAARQ